MVLPQNANVYYAVNTAYNLNFILRPKKTDDTDSTGKSSKGKTKLWWVFIKCTYTTKYISRIYYKMYIISCRICSYCILTVFYVTSNIYNNITSVIPALILKFTSQFYCLLFIYIIGCINKINDRVLSMTPVSSRLVFNFGLVNLCFHYITGILSLIWKYFDKEIIQVIDFNRFRSFYIIFLYKNKTFSISFAYYSLNTLQM